MVYVASSSCPTYIIDKASIFDDFSHISAGDFDEDTHQGTLGRTLKGSSSQLGLHWPRQP